MPVATLSSRLPRGIAALCLGWLWLSLAANQATAAAWQNPIDRFDVNADGRNNSADVLHVINRHLTHGPGLIGTPGPFGPPPYFDVSGDDYLTAIDSLLLINRLTFDGGAPATAADTAQLKLEVTDLDGAPISTAELGDRFRLRLLANDNRNAPTGVNSANADLTFDGALVKALAHEEFGDGWQSFPVDLGTPGLLVGAGGVNFSTSAIGGGWNLLDSFEMQATALGVVDFSAALGTGPLYDLLLWGVNDPIPQGQIEIFGTSLEIVPEPASWLLGALAGAALLARRSSQRRHKLADHRDDASVSSRCE